jgi:hypothetical protein
MPYFSKYLNLELAVFGNENPVVARIVVEKQ